MTHDEEETHSAGGLRNDTDESLDTTVKAGVILLPPCGKERGD